MTHRARRLVLAVVLMWAALACAIPIPTLQPLERIDPVTEPLSVGLEGAPRAAVKLRLVAGDLVVYPFDGDLLLEGQAQYNVKVWAPQVSHATQESLTTVSVNQGIGSQIPLSLSADDLNTWSIGLRRGVPLDLAIDLGAGKAQLDLGGLHLTGLSLTSGSAETFLTFGVANPVPLGDLRLTAGAGKLTAVGLGNANFDRLSVLGAAGALDLDFSGAISRSAVVDLKAGAGSITLRTPAAVGVRVVFSGTPVSRVDVSGFSEQSQNIYVNGAYGAAPLTLVVNLTTGVGAVKLLSQ